MLYKMAYFSGAIKAAKIAGVSNYLMPALGGATLGAGAGALAAPENQRLEGALLGGAFGAAGTAAGKAVGRGIGKADVARSRHALSNPPPKHHPLERQDLSALEAALEAAKERAAKHELGGTMLGSVAGIGGGVYANKPKDPPYPTNIDPYSYSSQMV